MSKNTDTYCIYKIENKINGKVYIGQAKNFNLRMNSHRHSVNSGKNYYLYNAIRKYGWDNFTAEVIKDNIPKRHIAANERYYIRMYNCMSPNGYNLTSGGEIGKVLAPEVLKELSEKQKGEKNHFYGKKHSEVTKFKMSAAQRRLAMNGKKTMHGKKHTEAAKKKISKSKTRMDLRKPSTVNIMIAMRATGMSYMEIGDQFNCSDVTAASIIKGAS